MASGCHIGQCGCGRADSALLLSMKTITGFGADRMHETHVRPLILQMKKQGFRDVELPNIIGIVRVKAQSLPPDFRSHHPDSSFFCSMFLCPLQYVLMLGGCYQLSIETITLRKSGPLEKAWPNLHKSLFGQDK